MWKLDGDRLSCFVLCRLKTHFEDNPVELGDWAKSPSNPTKYPGNMFWTKTKSFMFL
jgi:hypothetical protein